MSYVNTAQNPTYAYVNAFVDELQRAGLQNIVICPGSRSTPLAIACAEQPALKVWMHVDERSAAFFALGMAKRLHQPVALLCTSGTAAANFFPAITEARLTHVPLLVLTADRPHELRDNGAPQAIDQNRLYGSHVKWFVEVALPEATNSALRYIRTIADRAVALTQAVPAGPVHLNFPFREPLTPGAHADQPLPPESQRDEIAWHGRADNTPYISVHDAPLAAPPQVEVARLAQQVNTLRHGLIIAGPYDNPALTAPLVQLAARIGYPILADPLSQLRTGSHNQSHILTSYDAFLRVENFCKQNRPEIILRFGTMPTAKPLLLYMKQYEHCPQIVIDSHGGWDEPTQLATEMIHTDPTAFCLNLLQELNTLNPQESTQSSWLKTWQQADQHTREAIHTTMMDFAENFEGRIFTELNELLPEESTLFAGNSMPVRDMDTFFWGGRHSIHITGNRGANGIDGVISSALGTSAAAKPGERTVLVIGDLSFFHDLNGLLAARLHQLNLVIVLVNNDGGGIFSFLPQASYPEHFEQLFGTPTGLEFQPVVQMYGGTFTQTQHWQEFHTAVKKGLTEGGLHVVEVQTERSSNVAMHRQLWQVVGSALQDQEE